MVSLALAGRSTYCQEAAEDPSIDSACAINWGLEADFNTKYLWRGITYNDGLVIQPYLWASFRNFSAGIWSSQTAWDRHNSVRRPEFDLVLTYLYSIGKFEIDHTAMLYYYVGQEDAPPTGEFFTGIGYPVGNFKLVSSFTVDFLTYAGAFYVEHGIEYEKEAGQHLVFSGSVMAGWASAKFNDTYLGINKTTANLVSATIGVTYTPAGAVYFNPHLQIGRTLHSELVPQMGKLPWFCGLLIGFEL